MTCEMGEGESREEMKGDEVVGNVGNSMRVENWVWLLLLPAGEGDRVGAELCNR